MIKKLVSLADFLDSKKLFKYASEVDSILRKLATPFDAPFFNEEERSELLLKTKKIKPNVYVGGKIFSSSDIKKYVHENINPNIIEALKAKKEYLIGNYKDKDGEWIEGKRWAKSIISKAT